MRMGKELILADYPMPKRVMIICPDKSQAKELYWDALLEDLDGNPLVDKTNSTSLTVTFKGNRPQLMLKGANDREGDTIRGSDIPFGVFDEFQDWNYVAFNKVVTPAMASTTKSQAVIMGTPKGKGTNPMYLIYRMAEEMPEQCHSYHFYTMDNPAISRDEIARAKATMPERDFREEFMASFEDFPGRIFSELDHSAVITIPQLGKRGVRGMGVDWGDVNPAFTVWEFEPGEHGVITYLDGYINDRDTPITFAEQKAIIRALCLKYDVRLIRCDPSRPAEILELQHEGERYGIEGMRNCIAGDNAVKSGNAYVHSIIHQNRLRILTDPSTQQLDGMYIFDRMVAYHRKQLRDGSFVDEVAPGQDDHVCFTGDTLILTPLGFKPIWLIRQGDIVITPIGGRPVTHKSKRRADIWLGDGLKATADHPFWTYNGWQQWSKFANMGGIELVYTPWQLSNLMDIHTPEALVPNITDVLTIHRSVITLTGTYTELCTLRIMEKFLRDIMYITLTTTQRTILLKTWQFWKLHNTLSLMHQLSEAYAQTHNVTTWPAFEYPPQSGIAAMKGENGTESMGRVLLPSLTETLWTKCVVTAVSLIKSVEPVLIKANTAIRTVKCVPEPVGCATVHTLTVDDANCYYVKGLSDTYLVSNCDATRYILFNPA